MIYGYVKGNKSKSDEQQQVEKLKEHGCEILYIEISSGKYKEHSQRDLLYDNLKVGDVVVVYRLEVLGMRSVKLINILKYYHDKGIEFTSLTEDFDTRTESCTIFFNMWSLFINAQKETASESSKEAVKEAKRRGISVGRKPFNKEKINDAINLYDDKKYTLSKITDLTGVSKGTLYKYLNLRGKI